MHVRNVTFSPRHGSRLGDATLAGSAAEAGAASEADLAAGADATEEEEERTESRGRLEEERIENRERELLIFTPLIDSPICSVTTITNSF